MSETTTTSTPPLTLPENPLDEFESYLEALREAGIAVLSDSSGSNRSDGEGDEDDLVGDSILVAPRYVDVDAPLVDDATRKHARSSAVCMWCMHARADVTFHVACAGLRVGAGMRLSMGAYCTPECLLSMAASPHEFGHPDSQRHYERVKRAVRAWARYRVRRAPGQMFETAAPEERSKMLSLARAHLAPHELALVTEDDDDDDTDADYDDGTDDALAGVLKSVKAT